MTDVSRLTRLQQAVRAAAAVDGETGHGAEAIGAQYNALRKEVETALPEAVVDEFRRLFPEVEVTVPRGRMSPEHHFAKADLVSATVARLKTLVGWLEGVIQTADDDA